MCNGIIRLVLPLSLLALGCGGTSNPGGMPREATVPVQGLLRYQNRPVPDASVTFFSLDGKIAAQGKTDNAGAFILSTYGSGDGAPPGKYKVVAAVSGVKEIEPGVLAPEPPGGFKSPIPTKYANSDTTDVVVEVTPEGKNQPVIDLK